MPASDTVGPCLYVQLLIKKIIFKLKLHSLNEQMIWHSWFDNILVEWHYTIFPITSNWISILRAEFILKWINWSAAFQLNETNQLNEFTDA